MRWSCGVAWNLMLFAMRAQIVTAQVDGTGESAPVEETTETSETNLIVSLGRPDIEGHMPRALVTRVLERHLPELQACVDEALAQGEPAGPGSLRLYIGVSPAAYVDEASYSDLQGATTEQLAACIVERTLAFRFPENGGYHHIRVLVEVRAE